MTKAAANLGATPQHYRGNTDVQPVDLIRAFDLNFFLGNVVKYACRAGRKNNETLIDDLNKAAHYLALELAARGASEPATCFDCAKPAVHSHHVIPASKGGIRTVPLCENCHGKVHSRSFETTSELVKSALEKKVRRGEWTGGVPPYGFRVVDGVLEENPSEQANIDHARKLRAAGVSIAKIGAELSRRGARTRTGRKFDRWAISMIVNRKRRVDRAHRRKR